MHPEILLYFFFSPAKVLRFLFLFSHGTFTLPFPDAPYSLLSLIPFKKLKIYLAVR